MSDGPRDTLAALLRRELGWMVALRWGAGLAIVAGDLAQGLLGPVFRHPGAISAVGAGVLAVNGVWAALLRRERAGGATLGTLAWAQILGDLTTLTALVALAGGIESPILALYLLHMIFASLVLPGRRAYAAAALAIVAVSGVVFALGQWPATLAERGVLAGWCLSLLTGVYVAGHVTRRMFARERACLDQLGRLEAMQSRLDTHEGALAQQEKLVAIGQLAAGVAHEVSNPLASMDGLLQLMQRTPDKPRPEAVEQLREQVARISQTVRHLGTLSHPDLGSPERVSLNGLVEGTLGVLAYDHRLRRVEVVRELDPDAGEVRAVPRAVQQAIMNLVLNALDAMEAVAEPRLVVRTRRDGAARVIEVADNGHGIPEGDRARIMEPFVTTKPAGRGTGLGLPITLRMVREQHGDLSFETEPNVGTTFRITLPSDDHEDTAAEPIGAAVAPHATPETTNAARPARPDADPGETR